MERKSNRLIKEKSPYLLQHAYNPVDWYPWSEEAFEAAKKQDKPIFLSIGYATCHWCHVMEKESFENEEVANLLNDAFINIKVDREELPEVDSTYMEFAQALMSSAGGWPLNVILTPDLKPFFAVTYLPPEGGRGLTGLKQFVSHIRDLWRSDQRPFLVEQAEKIVAIFKKAIHVKGSELPDVKTLIGNIEMMLDLADPVYGGIKGEPKFPLGYQTEFLLEFARAHDESRCLFYVDLTLDRMARGGIYDHLGGGFARYAIDVAWQIPHFEKMLYDNAILSHAYLQGWKFTKNSLYEAVVRQTLDYILRDMSGEKGGFYSAEDADTEGREGLFYTWTHDEVQEALGGEEAELFTHYYGMVYEGNFQGRNCLHIPTPLDEFAEQWSIPEEELSEMIEKMRQKLFEKRNQRTHPFKDDKVITSWNGLAIAAFISAGVAFDEPKYVSAAVNAAEFIRKELYHEGKILRRFRDGDARFPGGLEDYAFLIKGLLNLFNNNQGSTYLKWALDLAEVLEKDFKAPAGAFYQTGPTEKILLKKCEFYDGAEPSGNAVHCENLLRLYQITENEKYLSQAEDILKAVKVFMESYPPGACYHTLALQRYLNREAPTVIIALNQEKTHEKEIRDRLAEIFYPSMEIIWKRSDDSELLALIPGLANKEAKEGKTTVHICRQSRCEPPLVGFDSIMQAFNHL
jgi:uncharacterized protein